MEMLASFFLLWGVFSSGVLGYSNGKISASCSSMVPGHGLTAQNSAPPYAISTSQTSFAPGDEIIVSLTASGDSSFEGFLLQARAVGGDVAVGHFRILDPNSQGLACNDIQNSSLSHTNKAKKQNITAIWIAAPGVGHVEFRATAVYNFSVYWTQVQSQVLVSSSSPLVPTFSSTTISTEEGCGKYKFCFSNPAGCSPSNPNCYFMSSAALGSDAFQFEISGLSDGYVAIAFSDDTIMGDDDVYICGKNGTDRIEVQHAFSTGRSRPSPRPLGNVDVLTTSFSEGIIRCSFISRNPISTQPRSTDSLYYVFLAFGPSHADGEFHIETGNGDSVYNSNCIQNSGAQGLKSLIVANAFTCNSWKAFIAPISSADT